MIEESRKPFWDVKRKLYDLKDCACGGTQDAGEVGAMYIGAVGRGEWCIYCKRCLTAEKAPTEAEAVEKWSDLKGKYVRACTDGWGNCVHRFGHITDDKWFDQKEFFKDT